MQISLALYLRLCAVLYGMPLRACSAGSPGVCHLYVCNKQRTKPIPHKLCNNVDILRRRAGRQAAGASRPAEKLRAVIPGEQICRPGQHRPNRRSTGQGRGGGAGADGIMPAI